VNHIATCIMSFAQAQDCIDRHINLWSKYNHNLFFYSSSDSYPNNTHGYELFKMGESGHSGTKSIVRHMLFFKHMVSLNYKWYLINDYDSINFINPIDIIGEEPLVFGNVFYQEIENQNIWKSPMFIHPPYIIHNTIMRQILQLNLSPQEERGFFDRWLGLCCTKLNIHPKDFLFSKTGYAKNTIEKEDLCPEIRQKKFIHGIKSQEVLDYILE